MTVTISTTITEDNENNSGTGVPDNDFNDNVPLPGHYHPSTDPVEFRIPTTTFPIVAATLTIVAFDVDTGPSAVNFEYDLARINGHDLSYLTRSGNQVESTTDFVQVESLLNPFGDNLIAVFNTNSNNVVSNPWTFAIKSATLVTSVNDLGARVPGTFYGDIMTGDASANNLDGALGADTMRGLGGNDIYNVDNAGDVVDETGGDGSDTVRSNVTFSLSDGAHAKGDIENLTLLGDRAIDATGNGLANVLTGNTSANVLRGLGGNDTYVVDSLSDIVDETGGSGTDTVRSSIGINLGYTGQVKGAVENLVLLGTQDVYGSGNALPNDITGNAGANLLSGTGNDHLRGLAGNDIYVIAVGDVVDETGGSGNDSVVLPASFSLTDAVHIKGVVENLGLAGTGNFNATGNGLANRVGGNPGANLLDGALGNDALTGREGKDTFAFTSALGPTNIDAVTDFSHKDDTIALDNAVFAKLTKIGVLKDKYFHIGSKAADKNDHILYNKNTGVLSYDSDGKKHGADPVPFATLEDHLKITHGDLLVI